MTQQTSAFPSGGPVVAGGTGGPPTGGASGSDDTSVKDKAAESAQAGKQAAGEVASTAADHAKEVAGTATKQARDLVGEARDQVRTQTVEQHQRAVSNLRSLGDELSTMADSSEQGGIATELVGRAASQAHGVAEWLDGKQPEEILDEVRSFARRRPGAFLLGALAAGIVAGRLTRSTVAAHHEGPDSLTGLGGLRSGGDDDETAAGSGGAPGPTPTPSPSPSPSPGGYSMPGEFASPDIEPTPGTSLGERTGEPGAIPGGPVGGQYGGTTYTAPGGRHAGEVGDVPPLGGPA